MADRTVIQWDKDDLDALGLLKVDVLALGMLTAIRTRARPRRRQRRGRAALTVRDIPAEDPAVYDMICRGRHGRRVPDREPRADEHAAAPAAARVSTTW